MRGSNFVDWQVLQMVKNRPGVHIYGLVGIANKEHKTRTHSWTYDDIKNAVNRLEKKGHITSEASLMGGRAQRRLYPVLKEALH